jgi:hypothetical protein
LNQLELFHAPAGLAAPNAIREGGKLSPGLSR